jgi:tetratricopeptide (TPR) repeat protein
MTAFSRASIELIPEWLAATRDVDIATGLSREEALLRARKLRHLIREGKVSPKDVELDEEGKDVLHALLKLLSEASSGSPTLAGEIVREADVVFRLIRDLRWTKDEFAEKAGLLRSYAELGWTGLGTQGTEVDRLRTAYVDGGEVETILPPNLWRREAMLVSSMAEALGAAHTYFLDSEQLPKTENANAWQASVLFATCSLLRNFVNNKPAIVAERAAEIHHRLKAVDCFGLFDERSFLLAATAMLAGSSLRIMGERAEAEAWLMTAESDATGVLSPLPLLARIAFERLILLCDMHQVKGLLDALPPLIVRFEQLGMRREVRRAGFVVAMILKALGRNETARQKLEVLLADPLVEDMAVLRSLAMTNLAEVLADLGRGERTFELLGSVMSSEAMRCEPLSRCGAHIALAEVLRDRGQLPAALDALRIANDGFEELRMSTYVAYTRLLIAEILLLMNRNQEAENEIRAALPTIEKQKMATEGFAALAFLKESLHRRTSDPEALRELRVRLQFKGWN